MTCHLYEAVGRMNHPVIMQAPSTAQSVCPLVRYEATLCTKPYVIRVYEEDCTLKTELINSRILRNLLSLSLWDVEVLMDCSVASCLMKLLT